ncbi:MAG TPA: MBL fold metallo-hydrolase [Microvirga sp.]|jgi:glyoxylase-like metal-dependent hydrolase (beta-lactamase superfamily II)|nr:MBL fold metallo-hydrolase [Microvirga sp.]
MTEPTRRTILSAAGAATLGALAPSLGSAPAAAAAPPAGTQAPGYYRYKVGDFEVTAVTDGAVTSPLAENFVVNVKRAEVSAALAAAHRPAETLTVPYTPVVVNTGAKLVVIDTGQGEAAFERTKGAAGQFLRNLAAAGIDRNAVDAVVISHFHGDHVNGLLTADNRPAFPNAEVLVPRVEWAYWMDDGEMSRAPAGRMQDLFRNNRRVFDAIGRKVTPYEWDKDVVPGIRAVGTVGHSPGHTSYIVASGSGRVFVQSDVTNVPVLFARHPGWHAGFDQDPQAAEATRRRVYDMLVAEKMPVQGFHYPFPGLAHLEKAGDGYRETLAPWSPTL